MEDRGAAGIGMVIAMGVGETGQEVRGEGRAEEAVDMVGEVVDEEIEDTEVGGNLPFVVSGTCSSWGDSPRERWKCELRYYDTKSLFYSHGSFREVVLLGIKKRRQGVIFFLY